MNIQEEYRYFMENCTSRSSKSNANYIGGLEGFVTKRLKAIVNGFTTIYDYDDPVMIEMFSNQLDNDVEFKYTDTTGKNMYSNALSTYLQFLRARSFFMKEALLNTSKPVSLFDSNVTNIEQQDIAKKHTDYLTAIRTKPFLLLAGISGTGKSRIVKELAYASCPNDARLRKDPASPGNYCLIEVKPNWNDSTELLGYETVLNGGGYHLTKFVKFLIKAMLCPDVPFFVCLDEMNLAPVEQYFAEFLSVLESRKDLGDTIKSEPLIPASIFRKYEEKLHDELFPRKKHTEPKDYTSTVTDEAKPYIRNVYVKLEEEGLRIPRNLIVIGTVNMDDTTYQFSRKVIDRAMTIEMNEVDLDKMFDTEVADSLSYQDTVLDKEWFFAPFAQSRLALEAMNAEERTKLIAGIKETVGQMENGVATVGSLEEKLGKTPFRIAYRVVNELILHFFALRWENREASFEDLFNQAIDNILMMKVLPRIEGNEDLVKKPLDALFEWTNGKYPHSHKKIEEMLGRLNNSHFTSFWP